MRPNSLHALKLSSVSLVAALTLIGCGPPVGDNGSDGSSTAAPTTTAGNGATATSSTNSTGGTGSGTAGGTDDTTPTGTILPPSMTGGGASNANDCPAGTVSGNSCSPNGWCNYAKAVMGNNCSGCHGSFRTLASVKADTNVEGRITGKTMPPNTAGLPAADITKMKTWIDCGSPL